MDADALVLPWLYDQLRRDHGIEVGSAFVAGPGDDCLRLGFAAGLTEAQRRDVAALGFGEVEDGTIAVRLYHKPLVLLIWWGPVLMAFGGLLSLSDRRLRVGAPKPAKAARALQPAE